jgi:hypothetical protein
MWCIIYHNELTIDSKILALCTKSWRPDELFAKKQMAYNINEKTYQGGEQGF